jgi:hypothetical protein
MEKLWLQMAEMFGHRWTGSFGVMPSEDHAWAGALAGLTGEQLACGLRVLSASGADWPPAAPAFRSMCESGARDALGLPTVEQAYGEACRKAHASVNGGKPGWSHPVVYHAACEAGLHNLTVLPIDASKKLFARTYELAALQLMAGEPLRAIPKALPETVTVTVSTPGVGNSALAQLRGGMRAAAKTAAQERQQ